MVAGGGPGGDASSLEYIDVEYLDQWTYVVGNANQNLENSRQAYLN